ASFSWQCAGCSPASADKGTLSHLAGEQPPLPRFGIGAGDGGEIDSHSVGQAALGRQAAPRRQLSIGDIRLKSIGNRQINRPRTWLEPGGPYRRSLGLGHCLESLMVVYGYCMY